MIRQIHYYIYSPCGNVTALVEGTGYNPAERKIINDEIMKQNSDVEQVGFIENDGIHRLIMAGGEFCGNATRCAAFHYLKGCEGKINIEVSGASRLLDAGIMDDGQVWAQIPIYSGPDVVTRMEQSIYKVKMEGITHIIVDNKFDSRRLKTGENFKKEAMDMLISFRDDEAEALGIMFLERGINRLKIHPVVWVRSIDTLFYESACGSGTVAVAILESVRKKSPQTIEVLQPSGQIICARISMHKGMPVDAVISGRVVSDRVLRTIFIDL